MSEYSKNRDYRLYKSNCNYYKKTYNLDYDLHHDDYIRDKNTINKVVNKNINLEILFTIMKFRKKEDFFEALSKVLTEDDFNTITFIKEINENKKDLGELLKKD